MFLGTRYQNQKNVPNQYQMYQTVINVPKCPQKCTQLGIFGLKINHLATLVLILFGNSNFDVGVL
jgi:hypothetical protein